MPTVQAAPLPAGALLDRYAKTQAYTDCYSVQLPRPASLSQFVEAFYTTPLFKLERWLLSITLGLRSTDAQARELALGSRERFAAWSVEAREPNQVMLAAGRTRSWLMVGAQAGTKDASDLIFFGSAVVPGRTGRLGWQFSALLGFHKLYSRLLLGAAARRLASGNS